MEENKFSRTFIAILTEVGLQASVLPWLAVPIFESRTPLAIVLFCAGCIVPLVYRRLPLWPLRPFMWPFFSLGALSFGLVKVVGAIFPDYLNPEMPSSTHGFSWFRRQFFGEASFSR